MNKKSNVKENINVNRITKNGLIIGLLVGISMTSSYSSAEEKEESEQAEEQAEQESSLWGDLKKVANGASDKVTEMSADLSADASNNYDQAAAYSETVFNEFMQGVDTNIDALEKMGYVVSDLYISVDLIPAVSFRISKMSDVPLETQKIILKESGNNAVLSYAMKKLNKAYSMKMGDYKIKAVKMDLSLPPRTSVHFVKSEK